MSQRCRHKRTSSISSSQAGGAIPGPLRSPPRVRRENVVFCRHYRMARVPTVGAAPIGRERVGRGVIVKLGVSPSAGVRKSFAIPLDEINVMQGVRHHRRSGGQAIVRAHRWRQMLESGEYASSAELAKAEKVNYSYLSRISA
jgi:hypothetical protein